MKTKNIPVIY